MRWVEVVVVEVDVVAVLVAEADAGRAGWVAPRLPGRAVTACALAAGTGHRTEWAFLVTSINVPSVAPR